MKTLTGLDEGPEEGEILSDDLEDISDESMSFAPSNNGKSLSHSDHLHALSLSGVTDVDEPQPVAKPRKRRKTYSQRHARGRKRSRRKSVESDSSDNDTTLDRRLKLQLKAAVRVESIEAQKNNSLRTRLRAMVKSSGLATETNENVQEIKENSSDKNPPNIKMSVDSPIVIIDLVEQDTNSCIEIIGSCSENTHSTSENIDSASELSKSEDIDSELIQLRIEALKTAINNKFANRKKRKKENTEVDSVDDTNKENTNNNLEESPNKKMPTECTNKVDIPHISPQTSNESENNVPPSPDEDEDVLRALLLASMSKKITKTHPEPSEEEVSKTQAKIAIRSQSNILLNKMKTNNFKLNNNHVKRVINNAKKVVNKASGEAKHIKMPQVKPLIINVNSDSDSDWDLSSSPEKTPKKAENVYSAKPEPNKIVDNLESVIETSVVKCIENSVPKNVHNAIESTVAKFLREQRAKVESEIKSVNNELSKTLVNKVETIDKLESTNKRPVTTTTIKPQILKKNVPNGGSVIPEKPKVKKAVAELEKSALKFLPENKREEYKKLQNLLKLKKAQLKKPRTRRMSQKVTESSNNSKVTGITKDNANSIKIQSESNNLEKPVKLLQVNSVTAKNTPATIIMSKSNENNNKHVNLINKQLPQIKSSNISQPTVSHPNDTKFSTTSLAGIDIPALDEAKPVHASYAVTKMFHNKLTQTINLGHVQLSPKLEAQVEQFKHYELRAAKREQENRSHSLVLRNTLKQLQIKREGSLMQEGFISQLMQIGNQSIASQIQEKFKSLRPLVKNLNEVTKEQRCLDQEMERLMSELKRIRDRQENLHRKKIASINELVEEKKKIDLSISKVVTKPKQGVLVTSTPIKPTAPVATISVNSSFTASFSSGDPNDIDNQSETILPQPHGKSFRYENSKNDSRDTVDTWEQSTICNEQSKVLCGAEMSVADPNDIDKIIKKTEERIAVLEKKESFECRRSEKVRYVSPLDPVGRKDVVDPFGIMCPFEVNGTCKDPDCSFNHLPK